MSNSSAPAPAPPVPAPAAGFAAPDRRLRWYLPFALLLVVSLALVATSYLLPSLGHPVYAADGQIGGWFDVDTEGNVPTWWSTMLLAGAGVLHLAAAWVARTTRSPGVVAWVLVALLLLLMSLDEATSLHESLDELRGVIAAPVTFEYFWLVIGIPLAGVVLVVVAASGLRMPLGSWAALLGGFVLLFAGAVGLEVIGSGQIERGATVDAVVSYHIEEALEMAGASLIAVAPLAGLRRAAGAQVSLRLGPPVWAGRRHRHPAKKG